MADDIKHAPPGAEWVGRQIGAEDARRAWLRLVLAVHDASRPGGPLDGWVFHGTSKADALAMAEDGMDARGVMMRTPGTDETWWTEGTYWATAWIAAFTGEVKASDTVH